MDSSESNGRDPSLAYKLAVSMGLACFLLAVATVQAPALSWPFRIAGVWLIVWSAAILRDPRHR